MPTFVAGPVHRLRARRPAPTSGPGSTRSGSPSTTATGWSPRSSPRAARDRRCRGKGPARCRSTSGTWCSARWCARSSTWAATVPGMRLHCDNRHPARPRPRLLVGRDRRRRLRWRAAWSRAASLLMDDDAVLALAAEIEGHPDNVAPALLRRLHRRLRRRGRGSRAASVSVDPRICAVAFVPPDPVETTVARGLLPDSVSHADAAANAGRAALLVAALIGSRPELLLRATEDRLHQDYREPAMPEHPAPGARRCVRRVCRPSSRAPDPRCWCSPTPPRSTPSPPGCRRAGTMLRLTVDRAGARVEPTPEPRPPAAGRGMTRARRCSDQWHPTRAAKCYAAHAPVIETGSTVPPGATSSSHTTPPWPRAARAARLRLGR